MAVRKSVINVCDRDGFGKERPAAGERIYNYNGLWYKLKLCEQHLDAFDRDIGSWSRLAQEVDAPNGREHSEYFNAERREETRRLRELTERVNERANSDAAAAARAKQLADEEAQEEKRKADEALRHTWTTVPGAMSWTMTNHARQRMHEYGFQPDDLLKAAAMPDQSYTQPWNNNDNSKVHRSADCRIIVNETDKVIITVLPREGRKAVAPSKAPHHHPHPVRNAS